MHLSRCDERWKEYEGYAVIGGVFSTEQVDDLLRGLDAALHGTSDGPIRTRGGGVYAARNLLQLWPELSERWRQPPLPEILESILGPEYGLVRVLFFDKSPEQSWALPWHKDMTIAVKNNRLPSPHFDKPTRKAGVPHVEASEAVLQSMLTARIHLDEVTEENGPLKVIRGSHRTGKELDLLRGEIEVIHAAPGDVLLMRPLLVHSSGNAHPGTRRHRRILHLEFAATTHLPDGYEWHDFVGESR